MDNVNQSDLEPLYKHATEIAKLSFEAMKHLTTLNTGAIILMVAFIEKLFTENREWTGLLGAAVILFVVSLLAATSSVVQSSALLTSIIILSPQMEFRDQMRVWTNVVAFAGFLVGMICLSVFFLKNLY